jgi:hypothetical protein
VRNAAKALHDLWFYAGPSIGNLGDRGGKTRSIGYVADLFPLCGKFSTTSRELD